VKEEVQAGRSAVSYKYQIIPWLSTLSSTAFDCIPHRNHRKKVIRDVLSAKEDAPQAAISITSNVSGKFRSISAFRLPLVVLPPTEILADEQRRKD
jgi:hypothetical protein